MGLTSFHLICEYNSKFIYLILLYLCAKVKTYLMMDIEKIGGDYKLHFHPLSPPLAGFSILSSPIKGEESLRLIDCCKIVHLKISHYHLSG